MKYTTLGKTGLKVSEICLGAMTFGSSFHGIGEVDLDLATEMVKTSWEAGVNFFDTANVYSQGESEKILGQAIKDVGIKRRQAVIATKVRGPMSEEAAEGTGDVNNVGLSRKHIFESVEASLERLGTDYIDLYQIHGVDKSTPIEETLSALNDLVRMGKVRYIGCSNLTVRQLAKSLEISKAHDWSSFVSLQAYYSVAGRDLEYELLPLCREEGLGVLPWSPLAGGFLTGKFRRDQENPEGARRTNFDFPPVDKEEAYDAVEVMDEIAQEKEATIPQIALAWLLHQPGVTAPIIGAKKMSQLKDNLASAEIELSDEELNRIAETTEPTPIYPQWMVQRMHDED
ncbi:MAG TPA: aldo/keto reductase [Balneolaceae bacterium]|nr:aldo/keto reductase [Balneolaceae bacterium]